MEKETLYRFYKGEATSDEQRRLMEWLDADQENRRIFDRERGMYNALLLFAPEEKRPRAPSAELAPCNEVCRTGGGRRYIGRRHRLGICFL